MPFLDHGINEICSEPDEFHQLVRELSDVLASSSGLDSMDVNPHDVISIMQRYSSNEKHWSRYAYADPSRNYTRNLVDEGNGKSNLLVVVWNPGKGSPVHDHANAHCVMKVLKGTLQETLYTLPDAQTDQENKSPSCEARSCEGSESAPVPIGSTTYHQNEVTYIADTIGLHKITNTSSDIAVSLHLYTPLHAAHFGFNLFDTKTGKRTHVKQAEYFSDRGVKCQEYTSTSYL